MKEKWREEENRVGRLQDVKEDKIMKYEEEKEKMMLQKDKIRKELGSQSDNIFNTATESHSHSFS